MSFLSKSDKLYGIILLQLFIHIPLSSLTYSRGDGSKQKFYHHHQ